MSFIRKRGAEIMANMSNKKIPMPEEHPDVRNKNFEEVSLGYSKEQAIEEANRCLNCKSKPCVSGCPVAVKIPEFISLLKEGEIDKAAFKIRETNLMPAICGRVCPQESQCEKYCVRGIKGEPVAIGRLERFVADNMTDIKEEINSSKNGKKIAVIGSGPSGLTCAGELCRMGYSVTIFEALHKAGGVLVYGIPEFRLPKKIVEKEIQGLRDAGVEIVTNFVVGKTATIDDLFYDGFEAVFVGSGAGLPTFMNIPGEELKGVYSANEYLTRINLMKAYLPESDTPVMKAKHVVVCGGGNVAMDSARSALRMGADDVTIVYRRTSTELPARVEEVHHAIEEGIKFQYLTNPIEIIGDENGMVSAVKCLKMELGEPDASGRARPVAIKGSEFEINADCVIMAIGNTPNPLLSKTTKGLDVNKHGCLVMRDPEKSLTMRDFVYAGGDAVTGAATVILAMGAGKSAASEIDELIKKNDEEKTIRNRNRNR